MSKQNMVITLCQEDATAFVEALDRPVSLNHRFLKATQTYKETITNENYTKKIIKYIITHKQTGLSSVVEVVEEGYFKVVESNEGGLNVGDTYAPDVMTLMVINYDMKMFD